MNDENIPRFYSDDYYPEWVLALQAPAEEMPAGDQGLYCLHGNGQV